MSLLRVQQVVCLPLLFVKLNFLSVLEWVLLSPSVSRALPQLTLSKAGGPGAVSSAAAVHPARAA